MSVVQDKGPAAVPGTVQKGDLQEKSGNAESTVLIAENEVLFGTAAAQRLLPKEDHRWAVFRRIVAALALRGNDAAAQDDSGPRHPHHPRRLAYLEDARLEREMSRL